MARVVALYRYPVKGFTPERVERLIVQSDGRVTGDRVLAFRFADAAEPEMRDGLAYWPKAKGLALQDFPALAALRLRYDDAVQRVRIEHDDGDLLVEDGLDDSGRARITSAVTDYVLGTAEGARLRRRGRLPLVLVGDGKRSRFQDRPRGFVSIHSRASVASLGQALGFPVDDRRFRSNVVIDGVDAWAELDWDGRLRVGGIEFRAEGPIVRCLATHANPDSGVRDARVLTALTRDIGQQEPTLGRLLLPAESPSTSRVTTPDAGRTGTAAGSTPHGVIRIGDPVELG